MTTNNAQAVRQRLLQALADNRRPGFNFAGNFVGIRWPRIGADSVEVAMDAGPHVNGADGNVDVVALGVLMDLGLATVPRLRVPPGARQATVSLHAQFTGHPARGNLVAQTGEPPGGRDGPAGQRLAAGLVRNDQHVLMHLQGAFVLLPSPDGKHLAPLPWQSPPVPPASPLQPHELAGTERLIHESGESALAAEADRPGCFADRFWAIDFIHDDLDSLHGQTLVAPQMANRNGHVQGGVLLGLAMRTALATAAPSHPVLSSLSTWFVRPGRDGLLQLRARVINRSRSFVLVRTVIDDASGATLLELTSQHAALVSHQR
jgi:acyl-coenzyme A thioesterase PaaI-like protein